MPHCQRRASYSNSTMKKISILLYLPVVVLLLACGSGEERSVAEHPAKTEAMDSLEALQDEPNRKENKLSVDSVEFETAFQQFFTALQSEDIAMLNHFIHPELGTWIIEQPGAVPNMTRVTDISSFKRHYQEKPFMSIAQEVVACELQEEPFPSFDCAEMDGKNSGYSKDGCFVWKPEEFRTSGYWNYAGLTETEIDQIKATLPLVDKSVLHTGTSYEFHFGYVNNQWRLLFAKLIRPCSA